MCGEISTNFKIGLKFRTCPKLESAVNFPISSGHFPEVQDASQKFHEFPSSLNFRFSGNSPEAWKHFQDARSFSDFYPTFQESGEHQKVGRLPLRNIEHFLKRLLSFSQIPKLVATWRTSVLKFMALLQILGNPINHQQILHTL